MRLPIRCTARAPVRVLVSHLFPRGRQAHPGSRSRREGLKPMKLYMTTMKNIGLTLPIYSTQNLLHERRISRINGQIDQIFEQSIVSVIEG